MLTRKGSCNRWRYSFSRNKSSQVTSTFSAMVLRSEHVLHLSALLAVRSCESPATCTCTTDIVANNVGFDARRYG